MPSSCRSRRRVVYHAGARDLPVNPLRACVVIPATKRAGRYNQRSQMMSKILVLAASVAVALGSVAITSGVDARHVKHHASRESHGNYAYALKTPCLSRVPQVL